MKLSKNKKWNFKALFQKKSFLGFSLLLVLSACGTGADPLSFLDNSIPSLGPIYSTGNFQISYLQNGFSSTNTYWTFNSTFSNLGNYVAPANGIITDFGLSTVTGTSGYYLTIMHSTRLTTRIFGIQSTPNARVGDSVVAGQSLATFYVYLSSSIAFQVLLDGVPVCPLSYLNSAFRQTISGTWAPCQ